MDHLQFWILLQAQKELGFIGTVLFRNHNKEPSTTTVLNRILNFFGHLPNPAR